MFFELVSSSAVKNGVSCHIYNLNCTFSDLSYLFTDISMLQYYIRNAISKPYPLLVHLDLQSALFLIFFIELWVIIGLTYSLFIYFHRL